MSRFDFLKDKFQSLYEKCTQAEQATDISVKMLKIRQTLEYLVRELGEDGNDLFNNIASLSDRDILDENISKLFQRTRMITNRGIHENQAGSVTPDEGRTAMDNLAEIAVWYAVEYKKESFALKDFAAEDVIRAKRYLDTGVDTVENKTRHTVRDMVNVDPLAVAGGFDDDDDAPADPLEQDVFETDEEYAERIAQMDPIHIGYGILDMRKSDGYTNVRFLQHHLDKNRRVRFAQSPIYFFVEQAEQDIVIDGELVAKLRVHENDVYCDYSRIFLRSDEEDIPVQVICWDKIGYESEEDHQKRIEALPILPLALCKPIRKQYDIERQILPFAMQKFAYVHILMQETYDIPCERNLAKQVCTQKYVFVMFGKVLSAGKTEDIIVWNKETDILFATPHALELKKQEEEARRVQIAECLEKAKSADNEEEALAWYKQAVQLGSKEAKQAIEHIKQEQQRKIQIAEYLEKAKSASDAKEALSWYEQATQLGSEEAQQVVERIKQKQREQEQQRKEQIAEYISKAKSVCDEAEALFWYEQAAQLGSEEAQQAIERISREQQCKDLIDRYLNRAKAALKEADKIHWYDKAAKLGSKEAKQAIGRITGKKYEEAKQAIEHIKQEQRRREMIDYYIERAQVAQLYEYKIYWYEKAVVLGSTKAKQAIERIKQQQKEREKELREQREREQRERQLCEQKAREQRERELYEQRSREKEAKKKSSSQCFITTAVCLSFDKGDDCYELTQFRRFRDGYLTEQADGKALVEEYYRIAPRIVSEIDRLAEAKEIYASIWHKYLRECLHLIEAGYLGECKSLYVKMVRDLEKRYLS